MAFGFGFNKQKTLSSAEKCVQQGKLSNAISEYLKVLKADPKDLTVMNTVGDLHARLGNVEKAVECFKNVGDAYASQGFTVKAIAMYKKLSKLRSSLESVLRLAELYTQQGLFNDARAQYLQVAEEFLRTGELEQAVRIFQKTLEMDPENVAMRTRLAEVYVRLGKKTEAWQIFTAVAESQHSRGQLASAEEILQRMLTLDPGNSYALLLRGRNAVDSGDIAGGIQHLEQVADLDSHPDGLRTLLRAYLQTGQLSQAGTLASKLLAVHNDTAAMISYADALVAAGQYEAALQTYHEHADRLLATNPEKVLESLHSLIGHVRENTAALETLLELLRKSGENTHLTEVYELLAHAYVQSGELEKARDYYLKLTQLEPENQLHARNYQQVLGRLGGPSGARLITAEEGAVLVDELEATASFVDQRYADDVALSVRAALTDAELFVSYNMPAKALGPLLSALPQAPRDLRVNQRLAALYTRAGRFAEAAIACRTLQSVYHDAGYPDEATRYGELAAKYEERASLGTIVSEPVAIVRTAGSQEVPGAAASTSEEASSGLFFHAPLPPPAPEPAHEEFNVQPATAESEIDLSAEWDDTPSTQQPASVHSEEAVNEAIEEVRFYLSQGMKEQAHAAFIKLEQTKSGNPRIAALRTELAAAMAQSSARDAEEVSIEEIDSPAMAGDNEAAAQGDALQSFVGELESSLGEGGFLPQATAKAPAPEARPASPPKAVSTTPRPQSGGALGDMVSDLETSLGEGFLPEKAAPTIAARHEVAAASAQPGTESAVAEASSHAPVAMAAAASAVPMQPSGTPPPVTYQPGHIRPVAPAAQGRKSSADAGVDLADMFGELKQELEEGASVSQEDPETHYNLGVAFREMGLLDEAISELQKVCQAADHGHSFPQIMQTYTWLAQCFLDKGVPEAAIRWYERALQLSGIDGETRTALHYELASSYETAGNKPAALNHFMEVYGSNIDYRDVTERIKALKS